MTIAIKRVRHWLLAGGMAMVPFLTAGASAQQPGYNPELQSIRQQMEMQDRELRALRARLSAIETGNTEPLPPLGLGDVSDGPLATPAVNSSASMKSIDTRVADIEKALNIDAPAKDKPKENEGFLVGQDLKMAARWNAANGVTFETPNKDFVAHLGFRFQDDWVWFDQDPALEAPPAAGGIGQLQDGTFFRRIRPSFDGKAWEVVEWNCELALENTSQNITNVDEVWAGVTEVPVIGSVRVGHMKVPQGFEGDMVSSSKAMTFMERAAYTDAFYQNFDPGLWIGNSILDQQMTFSGMVYRQENTNVAGVTGGSTGAAFRNGPVGYSGRLTALPLFLDDGRHMLHLGVSGSWRDAAPLDNGAPGSFVQFRAHAEMRDAQGAFPITATGPGNSNRLVDTGLLQADSATVIGTEAFYVLGPASFQAEYAWATANDVVIGGAGQGDLTFDGGYVLVSYFLTGEHRIYDRRLGRLGSTYINAPFTPFWFVRTEDGGTSWGSGAWELAARYSYLHLNQGAVVGGIETGLTLGVNWYLVNNLKVQFEYLHNERDDLRPGLIDGDVDAFGTRVQFFF